MVKFSICYTKYKTSKTWIAKKLSLTMYHFSFWKRPQPYWKSFKLLISPRTLRIQHIYTVCECFMLTVLSSSKSLNALRISSLESFSLWKEITKISDRENNLQYFKGYNTVQLQHLHLVWKKIYVVSLIMLTKSVFINVQSIWKHNLPSFTDYAAAQNKERETKTLAWNKNSLSMVHYF